MTGELEGRDNDERYNIPKFTPEHERPHPELILEHYEEIKKFSLHIHDNILLPLLRLFAFVLELEDEEYFVQRHRYEAPGLEYLRYMKYHPSENKLWAIGHTDYNTLTFLFHQPVAGLQVQTKDGWRYGMHLPHSLTKKDTLTLQSTFQPGTNNSKRSRRPRISFRRLSQVNSPSSSSTPSRPKR